MKSHAGKLMTWIVVAVSSALLVCAAYFAMGAVRERSILEGEALLASENHKDAYDAFKKADKFSLRPDIRIVKGMAASCLGLEDYDAARKYYERAVKLAPNDAESHHRLGLLCLRAKDYGAADKEIEALRALNTEESMRYADSLAKKRQAGAVKGFFMDILKKIAPNLSEIPGLNDKPVPPTQSEDEGM
jgi:tetratricopeptide (TPR) repeat protein